MSKKSRKDSQAPAEVEAAGVEKASQRDAAAEARTQSAVEPAAPAREAIEEAVAEASPEPGVEAPADQTAAKAAPVETAPQNAVKADSAANNPAPTTNAAEAGNQDIWLPIDALDDSTRFQLCPEGEVDGLATSIVRDGQLFAIDVRPLSGDRFEIVCGFRRVAALRLLMRRKVLARVHRDLGDADALAMALAALVDTRRVDTKTLELVRDRLDAERRLTPMLSEILTRAITPEALELSPETVDGDQPVSDPCALVQRVLDQLAVLNPDLNQLASCWDALPREVRDAVLQQLVYPSDMARYLKKQPGGLF